MRRTQGERMYGVDAMGGWGCPHEVDGKCQKVLNRPCEIGMKGCVLSGRFRFFDESKNRDKPAPAAPLTRDDTDDKQ